MDRTHRHASMEYAIQHKSVEEVERLVSTTLPRIGRADPRRCRQEGKPAAGAGISAHQLMTRQLLDSVDKPNPVSAPQASGSDGAVLRTYQVSNVAAAKTQLRTAFPDESLVRIAVEPNTGQLVVLAPPASQNQISNWLAQQGRPASAPAIPSTPVSTPVAAPTGSPIELTVRLVHLRVPDIEASLLKADWVRDWRHRHGTTQPDIDRLSRAERSGRNRRVAIGSPLQFGHGERFERVGTATARFVQGARHTHLAAGANDADHPISRRIR